VPQKVKRLRIHRAIENLARSRKQHDHSHTNGHRELIMQRARG
jgi:hypothetical protein